jgi:hypothetical protein
VGNKYVEHKFVRYGATTTVQGTASTSFGAITFALAGMQGNAALTSLYDQGRIDKVEIQFSLRTLGTGVLFPRLWIYPDWDDSTPPTTMAQVQSHPRLVEHIFSPSQTEFSVCIEPRVALATYNGAFTGYSQPNGPQWIDTGLTTVQHYGAKYAITNFTDTTANLEYTVKYWISMRNPH